jgi:hypothetical protein
MAVSSTTAKRVLQLEIPAHIHLAGTYTIFVKVIDIFGIEARVVKWDRG